MAAATSEVVYAASPMSLHIASRAAAAWSSSRGGRTPGESSRSSDSATRTQLSCRVTPGVAALLQTRRPANRLMSADLPTLGNPTTATRTDRSASPRFLRLLLMLLLDLRAAFATLRIPFPSFALV